MRPYLADLLRLHGLEKAAGRVRPAERRLSLQEFTPDTVFINLVKPAGIASPLLKLSDSRGASCLLPRVPVFDHSAMVPDDFKGEGRLAAFISTADGRAGYPALVEYPQRRYIFNFDVEAAVNLVRREGYFVKKRPVYTYLPFSVQNFPPGVRFALDRMLDSGHKKQSPALFPAYPKDGAFDMLRGLFISAVSGASGIAAEAAVWPAGKKYAFMLTHDVDSGWVYEGDNLKLFTDIEDKAGVRGAWFFVTNLYGHDFAKIDALKASGHEIGYHCYNHDHKLAFLPERKMAERLDRSKWFIEKYGVAGFRSAHYLRTPALYSKLAGYVRYDSSVHDSYNPSFKVGLFREGCSTVHPFRLSDGGLLELPITVPEDVKLYDAEAGPEAIAGVQLRQIEEVKKRGGLATLVVHPEPFLTARPACLEALKQVLKAVSSDPECWIRTPKEIYEFWAGKGL